MQPKSNPSTLLHGAKHSTSNSSHNALVFPSQHQPANGDLIGTRPGLLQLHPTESNHWQDTVHTAIILTFVANDSLMDPSPAHLQQNTLQNWLQPLSKSFGQGSPNHHHSIKTLPNGKLSLQKGPSAEAHVLQTVQATTAQQTGLFLCHKIFSKRFEKDGWPAFSTIIYTPISYKHASIINRTLSSLTRKSYLSYKTYNPPQVSTISFETASHSLDPISRS